MADIYLQNGRENFSRQARISLPSTTSYAIVCANKVPREDAERQKKIDQH